MADADVAITAGSGTKIDTRTVGAGTDEHRQVIVLGDPTTAASVAGVLSAADAAAGQISLSVLAFNYLWNGSSNDRARTIESVSAAPNVKTGIAASGVGPGFDIKVNPSNLGTVVNNAVTWTVDGADLAYINIGTTTTGTIAIEVTSDDGVWQQARGFNASTGAVMAQTFTPTQDVTYGVRVSGWRQVRVRTATTLGATVAIKYTMHIGRESFVLTDPGGLNNVAVVSSLGDDQGPQVSLATYNQLFGWDSGNWDRIRVLDAFKTAAASPDVGLLGVAHADRRFTSVNLGTVVGNTQSWDCNGADNAMFYIGTSTTGTFTFEVSADGTNYTSAEVRDTGLDAWQTGGFANITPTSGKVYRVVTAGWRNVRIKTVTTLGATVAVTATLASNTTILTAIDTGPAPHSIGYSLTSKTVQTTSTQTGSDVWSPASGKTLVITSYQIQAGGTTAGTVQLWFGANADTTYTRGTDLAIFDGEFAPSATLKPGVVQTGVWRASAADHELHLTTSAAINPLTITVWGYEF